MDFLILWLLGVFFGFVLGFAIAILMVLHGNCEKGDLDGSKH